MPAVITEMRRRGREPADGTGGDRWRNRTGRGGVRRHRCLCGELVEICAYDGAGDGGFVHRGEIVHQCGAVQESDGTFHPPTEILIDPLMADTLTPEQRAAGLIEAAKICYCRGRTSRLRSIWRWRRRVDGRCPLEPVVTASLMAKKWFIETDEFDQGGRLLLNFGHTFGHAHRRRDALPDFARDGVAVGILCALEFRKRDGKAGERDGLVSWRGTCGSCGRGGGSGAELERCRWPMWWSDLKLTRSIADALHTDFAGGGSGRLR